MVLEADLGTTEDLEMTSKSVRVSDACWRGFKSKAAANGLSLPEAMQEALTYWVEAPEKKSAGGGGSVTQLQGRVKEKER